MIKPTRNLIFDTPANSDRFSGKGHERVSYSLARTIEDLDGKDAAVGLDGNWGSGKSSIIDMAADQLLQKEGDKSFYVMTFDLWANQSLFFRRAFLEKFIEWGLANSNLCSSNDTKGALADYAKKIGGREEEIEQSSNVSFNLLGAIFVLILPILPLIYAWLSPFAIKPTQLPPCMPDACSPITAFQHWLTVNGTLIVALILGLLYAFAIIKFLVLWHKSGQFLGSLKKLAGLIEKKQDTHYEKKLIRDVDPSNTEFSKTFREILALLQTDNRRIIFVFDNIDRLHHKKVATAWSDIQAVLQREATSEPERVLTAIVPYAHNVIEDALKFDDQDFNATELFHKSFDVIHHVAPPVISDSEKFFKTQLHFALEDQINDSVSERAARIFNLSLAGKPCTPRQISSFINDVSTLWVEWNAEIPVDAISVYVAHRTEIQKNRDASTIGKISSGAYKTRVACSAAELEEYLAMMAYSAPKDLAMEVALYGPIFTEITRKDSKVFIEELANSSGFPNMLGRVLDENISEIVKTPSEFQIVISNLAKLDQQSEHIRTAFSTLADHIENLAKVDPEDVSLYPEITSLPKYVSADLLITTGTELAKWTLRSLAAEDDRTEEEGTHWHKAIEQIQSAVEQRDRGGDFWPAIQKGILLPRGDKFVYGVASSAASSQNVQLKDFGGLLQLIWAIPYLNNLIVEPSSSMPSAFAQIIESIPNYKNLSHLLDSITEKLNTTTPTGFGDKAGAEVLINIFMKVASRFPNDDFNNWLNKLIENGAIYAHIMHILGDTVTEDTPEYITEFLTVLIAKIGDDPIVPNTPALQQHPQLGNISAAAISFNNIFEENKLDAKLAAKFAAAAQKFKAAHNYIFLAGNKASTKPIIQKIAVNLLDLPPKVTLKQVVYINGFIRLHELNKKGAIDYGAFLDKKYPEYEGVNPLQHFKIVSLISSAASQHWPNFLEKLDTALSEQTKENWQTALEENSQLLLLAQNRINYGGWKPKVPVIKEPLLAHLVSCITEEGVTLSGGGAALFDSLPPQSVKALCRDVIDRIQEKPIFTTGLHKLSESCPAFFRSLDSQHNINVAFDKIIMPMIEGIDSNFANVIQQEKKFMQAIIKQMDEARIIRLQEVLSGLLDKEDLPFKIGDLEKALDVKINAKALPVEKDSTDGETEENSD